MTNITATTKSAPISVTVTSTGSVAASVGTTVLSASVSGGIGPQGPAGNKGAGLADLTDVALTNLQDGDLLRYEATKWQNVNETTLCDGGNF